MSTETEEKRGPGRPPKPEKATLVYSPLDNGDPHTINWNGKTFRANVPVELAHATHGEMIALAKGNPHFSVDGKSHSRAKADRDPVPLAGSDMDPVAADDRKMVEAD